MSQSDLKHFFFEVVNDTALQKALVSLAQSKGLSVTEEEISRFAEQNGRDKTVDHKQGLPPPKLSGK